VNVSEGSEESVEEEGKLPPAVFELTERLVEEREGEDAEEEGFEVPVMLNCLDCARMATPVGLFWTRLIWKPLPVGQPEEGAVTEVDPEEVRTSCFKTVLVFGYTTMFTKTTVKLVGSVLTEFQPTV